MATNTGSCQSPGCTHRPWLVKALPWPASPGTSNHNLPWSQVPFLSSCQGFSPCWRFVAGILLSNTATAQPSSESHRCSSADRLPCLFSNLSHHCGHVPWSLSCVLPWVALIKSDPGPDLWIYFLAWPQTHHITMNSPDNLDLCWTWLPSLRLPCSPCLGSVGSGLWLMKPLLCHPFIVLSSWLPFPSGAASPHCTLKNLFKALVPLLLLQMTPFRLQESWKYLCYVSKTLWKDVISISFLHKVLYRLYCGIFCLVMH